ncbi:sugar 3,4-ketoisomerase [Flavobacterium rhizosphaerae]|uniref:FdtA/QdtA family cupin domain-containing protein n=1 Tax=Flavobacterium rhizosphaerae TaxID=3163298 RepID=A0ABW8Z1Y2_9FLAO
MTTTINDIKIIDFPVIEDARGNLAFVQHGSLPYDFKRVYYLYDVPGGAERGGHAHIDQQQILIALSGSFDVILDDGKQKKTYTLNRPSKGLHVVKGLWRELQNFSSGAVCLVIAQDVYDEADYIREYEDFVKWKNV